MEIIIGRNENSSTLLLTVDGKEQQTSVSVPSSVDPQHCKIVVNNGQILLRNIDINNYTYVNGQAVESKKISPNDQIALGPDRFLIDWSVLKPYMPVDISHLQQVWEEYEHENISLQIAERKFNTLRSATGIFTMVAIALSIATGGRSVWYIVLYGAAIIISLIFFVKAYRDSSKMPQKRQQLSRQFQRDYVCPHCGHFLGNQTYDILVQNDCCPYCKTKFIH